MELDGARSRDFKEGLQVWEMSYSTYRLQNVAFAPRRLWCRSLSLDID